MPKLGILYGSLIKVGVAERAIATVIIVNKVEIFRKKNFKLEGLFFW